MAANLYLIFGDDEYLVSTAARELVNRLVPPDEQALGMETVDGAVDLVAEARTALETCLEAALTPGLFGGAKLVWFKDVRFLTDNQTGRSEVVKDAVGRLADAIKAGLPEGIILVISAAKVNKRYAFYKACKARGELQEHAMPDKAWQADKIVAEKLKDLAADRGLKLSGNVAEAFLEKAGHDTRQIASELDIGLRTAELRRAVTLGGAAAPTRLTKPFLGCCGGPLETHTSDARRAGRWIRSSCARHILRRRTRAARTRGRRRGRRTPNVRGRRCPRETPRRRR